MKTNVYRIGPYIHITKDDKGNETRALGAPFNIVGDDVDQARQHALAVVSTPNTVHVEFPGGITRVAFDVIIAPDKPDQPNDVLPAASPEVLDFLGRLTPEELADVHSLVTKAEAVKTGAQKPPATT